MFSNHRHSLGDARGKDQARERQSMSAGWHQKFAMEAYLPPLIALSKWGAPAAKDGNALPESATLVVQWPNCFKMGRMEKLECQSVVKRMSQHARMWVLETHDWAECLW